MPRRVIYRQSLSHRVTKTVCICFCVGGVALVCGLMCVRTRESIFVYMCQGVDGSMNGFLDDCTYACLPIAYVPAFRSVCLLACMSTYLPACLSFYGSGTSKGVRAVPHTRSLNF